MGLNILDLILECGAEASREGALGQAIAAHASAVRASAGTWDRNQLRQVEDAVRSDPGGAFTFDNAGCATLTTGMDSWRAGRFETVSLRNLKARAQCLKSTVTDPRLRLWVFDGASPVTDIGSLQATNGNGALFQVASQFNCLESPGRYVTRVCNYFNDYTQGPRASVSAFPGTLLRHYSAPRSDGSRFVQQTDGRQIDLLEHACEASLDNGYFTGEGVENPSSLVGRLHDNFDSIRVGVHDEVQVVSGYDWDGSVEDSQHRCISQVFTSTVAGGGYGGQQRFGSAFDAVCSLLLRAGYLGSLLSAVSLSRSRVILTLIGGGVFGNPIQQIWQAIEWSIEQVSPFLSRDLDIIVNGYNLGSRVSFEQTVLPAVRNSGGAILCFNDSGLASILR